VNGIRSAWAGLSLVFLSYLLRLAAGMAVMVFAARQLGPTEFGRFIYWLAWATLATVPVNLGLGTYVLREIGLDKHRYAGVMGVALTTKLLLLAVVLLVACGVMAQLPAVDVGILGCLVVAQACDGFGEFFNLGFRRDAQYQAEARCAVVTTCWHLVVMGAAIAWGGLAWHAALGFAVSRALGTAFTIWRSVAVAGPVWPAALRQVPGLLRATWAYAGELGLNTLLGQVDTLLVNHVLGPAGVGLYQAGMKLVDGACRLAPVMAQYLLPTLAAHRSDARQFRQTAWRSLGLVMGLGLLASAVLVTAGDMLAHRLYGERYQALAALMPLFALVLALRFLETGLGLLLVAAGLQGQKVWLVALQLVVLVGAGYPALRSAGLVGWQVTVAASLALVLTLYAGLLRRDAAGQRPLTT